MKAAITSGLIIATFLFLQGCGAGNNATAVEEKMPAVDVAPVAVLAAQSWKTYTSRLEAPEVVQLMPRISGIVEEVRFKEGSKVSKGDVLFTIDDEQFKSRVETIESQIAGAEAALAQAKSEFERGEQLAATRVLSQEQALARQSTYHQRQAELSALKAQLHSAKLDLSYTKVTAPISGIVSRAFITQGNNVVSAQSVLTSIVSDAKRYAYFDIDERTWNAFFASDSQPHSQVAMQLLGESEFTHIGDIDFVDNQIDSQTGTLRVRAVFEQSNNNLKAGAFVRVRLPLGAPEESVFVPETSLGTDLENKFVLTLDENNVLQYRKVDIGERFGQFRQIKNGLSKGEVIAIHGAGSVSSGAKVAPRKSQIDVGKSSLLAADFPAASLSVATTAKR